MIGEPEPEEVIRVYEWLETQRDDTHNNYRSIIFVYTDKEGNMIKAIERNGIGAFTHIQISRVLYDRIDADFPSVTPIGVAVEYFGFMHRRAVLTTLINDETL